MDIKTFVSETLIQIVEGVADAQRRIDDGGSGAKLNPIDSYHANPVRGVHEAKPVDFDIAVTVATEDHQGAGARAGGSLQVLAVVGIKAGASINQQSSEAQRSETVSRVRFAVQLAQPGHHRQTRDPLA